MDPGLTLHLGENLSSLARHFADLRRSGSTNVLEPDWTIVPSAPVRQWLDWHLSDSGAGAGITANLSYIFPEEFVTRVESEVIGPRRIPWDRDLMTARLLAHTPGLSYRDARRHAEELDEVIRWRPEVLHSLDVDHADIHSRYHALGPTTSLPLAQREACENALSTALPRGLPERLFFFGLPNVPGGAAFVRFVSAVAHHCDVHVFVPVPNGTVASPVLSSWRRDSLDALQLWREANVATLRECVCAESSPPPPTLLGAFRERLRGGDVRATANDDSLIVVGCVGASRQAEVARDLILDAMSSHDIQPHEVLVVTPDPERFEAHLERHWNLPRFENGHRLPRLPYEPTELTATSTTSRLRASAELLGLMGNYATVDHIRSFCETGALRAQIGLDQSRWDRLWRLARQGSLTFGVSSHQRSIFNLYPDDHGAGTWEEWSDDVASSFLWPPSHHRGVGVASDIDIVATLQPLLRILDDNASRRRDPTRQPVTVWVQQLQQWMHEVAPSTATDDDDSFDVATSRVNAWFPDGEIDETRITFDDFAELWGDLAKSSTRQRIFGRWGVTVTRATALVGAPYRLVCLLGFDEPSLPPTTLRSPFLEPPRAGDPDPRRSVVGAIFAAVGCASERLIITFDARNEENGRSLDLAIPLSELVDVVRSVSSDPTSTPRSTSRHLFDSVADDTWRAPLFDPRVALVAVSEETPVPPPAEALVAVSELHRFVRHPVRYHVAVGLASGIPDDPDAQVDVPPISLNPLERSALQRTYITALTDAATALAAAGTLPNREDLRHEPSPLCDELPCAPLHEVAWRLRRQLLATPGRARTIPHRLFLRRLQFPLLDLATYNHVLDLEDLEEVVSPPSEVKWGERTLHIGTAAESSWWRDVRRDPSSGTLRRVQLAPRGIKGEVRHVMPALVDLCILKLIEPDREPLAVTSFLPDTNEAYKRKTGTRLAGDDRLNPLSILRFDGTADDAVATLSHIDEWRRQSLVRPLPLFRRTSVAAMAPRLKVKPADAWSSQRGFGENVDAVHQLLFPLAYEELSELGDDGEFPFASTWRDMLGHVSVVSTTTSSRLPSRRERADDERDYSDTFEFRRLTEDSP